MLFRLFGVVAVSLILISHAVADGEYYCSNQATQDSPVGKGLESITYNLKKEYRNVFFSLQLYENGNPINDAPDYQALENVGDSRQISILHPKAFEGQPGKRVRIKLYFKQNTFLYTRIVPYCDLDRKQTYLDFSFGDGPIQRDALRIWLNWSPAPPPASGAKDGDR